MPASDGLYVTIHTITNEDESAAIYWMQGCLTFRMLSKRFGEFGPMHMN